jgi:hypothetical protein
MIGTNILVYELIVGKIDMNLLIFKDFNRPTEMSVSLIASILARQFLNFNSNSQVIFLFFDKYYWNLKIIVFESKWKLKEPFGVSNFKKLVSIFS